MLLTKKSNKEKIVFNQPLFVHDFIREAIVDSKWSRQLNLNKA